MRIPHYAQVYRARDGWRWRLVAGNGKIVADSGEAYASRRNARRAFEGVLRAMVPNSIIPVGKWELARRWFAILLRRGEGK